MVSEELFILLAIHEKNKIKQTNKKPSKQTHKNKKPWHFFQDGTSDIYYLNKLISASLSKPFVESYDYTIDKKYSTIRNKGQPLKRKRMQSGNANSYQYSYREIFIDCEDSTQSPVVTFLKFSHSNQCVGALAPQQFVGTPYHTNNTKQTIKPEREKVLCLRKYLIDHK